MTPNNQQEKVYVYGTRTKEWYLVGKEDRDYKYGISQKEFNNMSNKEAKRKYLQPGII